MTNTVRVAVTGAAGQIGYALLFRIASGQMFGPNTRVRLSLIELPQALEALEGVVMELQDCAFPLLDLSETRITSDLNEGMRDVNWAILVGAVPRKQGMERSDLLQINGDIFTKQGKAINDNAASDVRVFVVGNPCNTNCYIAAQHAPDVPKENFFAMTMLDHLRGVAQLAARANAAVTDVSNFAIWGNHSATQFPDFFNAKIKGRPAMDVINDEAWLKGDFVKTVQQRGAAIIKARGASSAASAANAIIQGVRHLVTDTPANDFFSMCKSSVGEYGVDEGLIFSYPCRVKNGRLEVVEGLPFNAYAQEKFAATLEELRQEKKAVKELGLV